MASTSANDECVKKAEYSLSQGACSLEAEGDIIIIICGDNYNGEPHSSKKDYAMLAKPTWKLPFPLSIYRLPLTLSDSGDEM